MRVLCWDGVGGREGRGRQDLWGEGVMLGWGWGGGGERQGGVRVLCWDGVGGREGRGRQDLWGEGVMLGWGWGEEGEGETRRGEGVM